MVVYLSLIQHVIHSNAASSVYGSDTRSCVSSLLLAREVAGIERKNISFPMLFLIPMSELIVIGT